MLTLKKNYINLVDTSHSTQHFLATLASPTACVGEFGTPRPISEVGPPGQTDLQKLLVDRLENNCSLYSETAQPNVDYYTLYQELSINCTEHVRCLQKSLLELIVRIVVKGPTKS